MPKKKSRSSKKKSSYFWQWFVIAAVSILLYQGLKNYFFSQPTSSKKSITISKKQKKKTPPVPTPTPTPAPVLTPPEAVLPAKWTFASVSPLLPKNAYPDNFQVIPVNGGENALLAYAKIIPGKKPGPDGQTNTLPGIAIFQSAGGKLQPTDLSMEPVRNTFGENIQNKLVGVPQLKQSPFSNREPLYSAKIFLDDPRNLIGLVKLDSGKLSWASLQNAKGGVKPAIFLEGTSETTTRKVRMEKRDGKDYLIIETGTIDLARAHEGYRWQVEAYAWNGNVFVYDPSYRNKKSS